jgi:predicted HTH transcriptional regulator
MLTEAEFEAVLSLGETTGVEFKSPGLATDRPLMAQVTKAILAMSNRRDGGLVIVGIEENGGAVTRSGLSAGGAASWADRDAVRDRVAEYADPSVHFTIEERTHSDGRTYLVIDVLEFDSYPVICRKSFGNILAEGAIYVRSWRKPESVRVRTSADMREVINLAVEKELGRFLGTAARAGGRIVLTSVDEDRFDQELGELG